MHTLSILSAVVIILIGQTQARGQQPPVSLVDVGEFGENIYDLAKAKDWTKIADKMKELDGAAKKLTTDLKTPAPAQKRLAPTLVALAKAVAAKDELGIKRQANQVTLIAADLIEPFNPEVPAAVTRLDYYGRELEISVAAKDLATLKTTNAAMRQSWEKLQPAVTSKGGAAEAKRFSELMAQVATAKTIDDYARIVTPILDEVDNLEKVFKKK